ncbi:MAG: Ribosomal-protein-S18p-alanine acetyltransferase [Nitrospira sp.]|nr:MAG: Ribosomal-protein-S18p-alanine acetyltransferase [Nitrospira sp.]
MENAIQIVPARLADLPDLLRLEEACFSAPWTRKMLEAELTGNQFAHFLVAREQPKSAAADGPIVGSLCFWIVFEEVRLMNLAVAEPMRRRGIGAALVDAALRAGMTETATRAVLEVRASNQAALALYRRFGFTQVSIRPAYYSNPVEDAVLMEMEPIAISAGSWRRDAPVNEGGSVPAH